MGCFKANKAPVSKALMQVERFIGSGKAEQARSPHISLSPNIMQNALLTAGTS